MTMELKPKLLLILLIFLFPTLSKGEEIEDFQTIGPQSSLHQDLRLKTNLLPWCLTIPNIGAEYAVGDKWSIALDLWWCPWKLSDKFSVKTLAILPEGRWWLKTNNKGSFFNIHLNVAWYNVRANDYRYQDTSRPLLGAGIGYGYRLGLNKRLSLEFEIGAGMANTKYSRYYNIPNGALKDTRITTYWGIDRASVALTYFICDI